MSPIRPHDVIDLCSSSPGSSPSPMRVRTRSQSCARSVGPKEGSSHTQNPKLLDSGENASASKRPNGRKWKGKQPLRSLGPVIELSDSEEEKVDGVPLAPSELHNGEQHQSSASDLPSGSGDHSGSSLSNEQVVRNVIPDFHGQRSRSSVPEQKKGKAKEKLLEEDRNMGGPNMILNDGGYIPESPWTFDVDPGAEATTVGPSNRPVTAAPAIIETPVPADPEPLPEPTPAADPPTQALAHILEVMPNVDPEFLYPHIATQLPNFGGDPTRAAEYILGEIFEMGDKVPKIKSNVKSKRKTEGVGGSGSRSEGDEEERTVKKAKIDWASVDRPFTGTGKYTDLALIYLQSSFPHIPKRYLRRKLMLNHCHYAPTHLALLTEEKAEKKGYDPKMTRYNPEKDRAKMAAYKDAVLEEERMWIVEREQEGDEGKIQDKGKGKANAVGGEAEEEQDGEGIECQCCFCEYSFAKMVQCPEAHLFCTTCVSQYAATQLGSHSATLICMHPSECKQPFPESELRRVLDSRLMDLYDRVKQQKEIEDAGLDDLEECPFCEWKCVFEASKEEQKLFRCGNEEGGCGVVSCRMCKKEDHLPKSCKEVDDDKQLDNQHVIEEAMTQALMRQCPKCKKPFIKDAGCNKMTCPNCRTLSCYVCREVINGYDHFDQTPPSAPSGSRKSSKCLLWDSVEHRHADEVKAAADKALAEYKKNNPDDDASGIKIDIPKAPPPPPPPAIPGGVHYQHNHNQYNIAAMHAHQARLQIPPAQLGGVWGPVGPPAVAPIPAVLPVPAQRPPPVRGPALIAQARRGAKRRRGAEPNEPRIAHQAANQRPDPAPILHRRFIGPGVLPAPNALPQFHFGLAPPAGLGDGVVPQRQPHYGNDEAAQRQRLREAFDLNERLRQNEIALGARLRTGAIRDAGVRAAPPAPINPTPANERNLLEQRLLEAQQKVALERMGLNRHMRMYQAERQGAVGALVGGGGGGIPAMGYNAALGMPMVPRVFDGSQYQPRK